MRITVFKSGGNAGTGGFVSNGLTLQGPLILSGPHSEPLHAVPKQYVDNVAYNLDANNITSGILPAGRLPAFTGDATTILGSSNIILSTTGVTPGSIVKPTVDAKGRVTSSGVLIESDIGSVGFNKISANKPTTLNGYGITNGVRISSDVVIENGLVLHSDPVNPDHAATKQYVDTAAGQAGGISVGDIIRKPYTTTPSGFLKCNGAELDKTAYTNLYSVIGDTFTTDLTQGSGKPWQQQYSFNNLQNTDVLGWSIGTPMPAVFTLGQAIVTNNRVYVLGGYSGSGSYLSTVYTAPINTDGTLGTWTTGTSLPIGIIASASFVTKDRVFLVGGATGTGTYLSTVYTAPINLDGTLGTWITTHALPGVLGYSKVIVTKNRVYTFGGYNGSAAISTIYTATINDGGMINSWSVYGTLPYACQLSSVAIIKDRVYLIGGYTAGAARRDVYYAAIDADGLIGSWTPGIFLPKGISHSECFVSKNKIYLTYTNKVYSADIASDGSLSTWSKMATLPYDMGTTQCVITNSKVYLLSASVSGNLYYNYVVYANFAGGLNDYSDVYGASATVNYMMPGSGKPWQQQYQINETQLADITGWNSGTALPITLAQSQAVVTKNRVYLLGGNTNPGGVTSATYFAAINSDGSLGTWTASGNLPAGRSAGQAIVTKNRVYLLGGSADGSTVSSSVYTAPINADGTLGSWTTGTALPIGISDSQVIVTKNYVYLLTGYNGTAGITATYVAPINTDGTLGTWGNGPSIPVVLYISQVIITKNRVYILGGSTNGTVTSVVYTSAINSNGTLSTWTASGNLPGILCASQAFVTKNRVYLLGGGTNGNTVTSVVYTAPINSDGTLGTWTTGTSLPIGMSNSTLITTKNKVYLLGGYNGTSIISSVYTTSILEGLNDYSPYYDGTINVDDTTINYLMPGSGRPWNQQYQINNVQSGAITSWVAGTSLPISLAAAQTVVTKNRVYLLGGYNGTTSISTVYTAPINGDGTLGTWTIGTSLPGVLSHSQAIVTNNRVYLLGGYNGTAAVSTVYTAPINSDGTLGTWTTGTALPVNLYSSQAGICRNKLYLIGGITGTVTATIYVSTINSDGTLGSWSVNNVALPSAVSHSTLIFTKNRLYLIGGSNGTNDISTVYTCAVNTDGSLAIWVTGESFPITMHGAQCFTTKNRVYIMGGFNSGTISSVYTAPVNADGTLGNWTISPALPGALHWSQSIITNTRIYLISGFNLGVGAGVTSTVYTASISEGLNDYSPYYDGTIQPVSNASTKFKLPDYSAIDKEFGEYVTSYIKF